MRMERYSMRIERYSLLLHAGNGFIGNTGITRILQPGNQYGILGRYF